VGVVGCPPARWIAVPSNAAQREIRELDVAGGPRPANDRLLLDRGALLVMQNVVVQLTVSGLARWSER
jgi:hypothetical protein